MYATRRQQIGGGVKGMSCNAIKRKGTKKSKKEARKNKALTNPFDHALLPSGQITPCFDKSEHCVDIGEPECDPGIESHEIRKSIERFDEYLAMLCVPAGGNTRRHLICILMKELKKSPPVDDGSFSLWAWELLKVHAPELTQRRSASIALMMIAADTGNIARMQQLEVDAALDHDLKSGLPVLLVAQVVERGLSALHHATCGGHLAAVDWLLGKGADIEMADSNGCTPLYWAVVLGKLDVAKKLAREGADPTALNKANQSMFMAAATKANTTMLDWLMTLTIDPRVLHTFSACILASPTRDPIPERLWPQVQTYFDQIGERQDVLHLLMGAAKNGDIATVARCHLMAKEGPYGPSLTIEATTAFDPQGMTALHFAARGGHCKLIEWLLKEGAEDSPQDLLGMTPMQHAADKGQLSAMKKLAKHGADLHGTDFLGNSLMHLAVQHVDVMAWLEEKGLSTCAGTSGCFGVGADEILQKCSGVTPMHAAAMAGEVGAMEWLVGKGAGLEVQDSCGRTPLAYAACAHSSVTNNQPNAVDNTSTGDSAQVLSAINWLVDRGANVTAVNQDGMCAFHWALKVGNVATAQALIGNIMDSESLQVFTSSPLGTYCSPATSTEPVIAELAALESNINKRLRKALNLRHSSSADELALAKKMVEWVLEYLPQDSRALQLDKQITESLERTADAAMASLLAGEDSSPLHSRSSSSSSSSNSSSSSKKKKSKAKRKKAKKGCTQQAKLQEEVKEGEHDSRDEMLAALAETITEGGSIRPSAISIEGGSAVQKASEEPELIAEGLMAALMARRASLPEDHEPTAHAVRSPTYEVAPSVAAFFSAAALERQMEDEIQGKVVPTEQHGSSTDWSTMQGDRVAYLEEENGKLKAMLKKAEERADAAANEANQLRKEKECEEEAKEISIAKFELLEQIYQPIQTENEQRKSMMSELRKAALDISRTRQDLELPTKRMGELDNVKLGDFGLTAEDVSNLQQTLVNPNFYPWRIRQCKAGSDEVETVVNWEDEQLIELTKKYDGNNNNYNNNNSNNCREQDGQFPVTEEVLRCSKELQQWNPSGGYCVTIPYHHGESRELKPVEILKIACCIDVPGCRCPDDDTTAQPPPASFASAVARSGGAHSSQPSSFAAAVGAGGAGAERARSSSSGPATQRTRSGSWPSIAGEVRRQVPHGVSMASAHAEAGSPVSTPPRAPQSSVSWSNVVRSAAQ
jgi:ankyrin repeat protein